MARFVLPDGTWFDAWYERGWEEVGLPRLVVREGDGEPRVISADVIGGDIDGDYAKLQRAWYARGAVRVRDPAREAAYDVTFEPFDAALEAGLRDNFAETAQVYGDWLAERGHPRGALAALRKNPRRKGSDGWVTTAIDRAAIAHGLLDPFAEWRKGKRRDRLAGGIELHWEHGFVRRADLVNTSPMMKEFSDVVFEAMRHPSLRALAELTVSAFRGDLAPALQLVATCARPPPLVALALGDREWIDRVTIGDTGALWPRFPRLVRLTVAGRGIRLGALALPALERLAIHTPDPSGELLAALAGTRTGCPMLQEIDLAKTRKLPQLARALAHAGFAYDAKRSRVKHGRRCGLPAPSRRGRHPVSV